MLKVRVAMYIAKTVVSRPQYSECESQKLSILFTVTVFLFSYWSLCVNFILSHKDASHRG